MHRFFVQRISSRDLSVRSSAAAYLGSYETAEYEPELLSALAKESDIKVRVELLRLLARSTERRILVEALAVSATWAPGEAPTKTTYGTAEEHRAGIREKLE